MNYYPLFDFYNKHKQGVDLLIEQFLCVLIVF